MANDRPTADRPCAMSRYVVRHPDGADKYRKFLYLCVMTSRNGDVARMSARPADDEDLTPVEHDHFAGSLRHGAFKTRGDASLALM